MKYISDDDLPLNKILKLDMLTNASYASYASYVRSVFEEDGK